ncbi:MAG TPA: TPM domain-containing protein [Casimicrobiaceae bacterium]|nr:TPM domain-containing protein [Casimicrobiaceae bacterium]
MRKAGLTHRLVADDAASAVEQRIAAVEKHCGVEIVCAVHARSGSYREAFGYAFAFGAVMTAASVAWMDLLHPAWNDALVVLVDLILVLGAAIVCALLTLVWPAWRRLFVHRARRDAKVAERAKTLFLEHKVQSTRRHTGLLLYASLFERKVQIIADRAFDSISAGEWNRVIEAMAPGLRQRRCDAAFLAGLDAVEQVLVARGFVSSGTHHDELPDTLLESDSQ